MNEKLNVKDRCLECPVIIDGLRRITAHNQLIDELIVTSTGHELPQAAEQLMIMVARDNPSVDTSPEAVARFVKLVRGVNGEAVQYGEEFIDDIKRELAAHALGCLGPVTTSASPDNRRQYVTTVCASPRMTDDVTELAVVKRLRL